MLVAAANEKTRLMWLGTGLWHNLSFYEYFQREHGAVFVPFSPLGRGYLSGALAGREFSGSDFRSRNPRFTPEAMAANEDAVLAPLREVAGRHGTSPAAVAIAWTTVRGEHVLPIPGTTDPGHLREDAAAADLRLTAEDLTLLDGVAAVGDRY